jgi:DNA invertase Pin-like site-specific DNA recombinase
LLEICGLFGALLADRDGIYDASDPNDRFVLGLKGQLSEMELHIIRSRLERGKLTKARRGKLHTNAPIGYVKTAAGGMALDPDDQVRRVAERLAADEWWLRDLAKELGMGYGRFKEWVKRSYVHARRVGGRKHLVIWADAEEREPLRRLGDAFRPGQASRYRAKLTRPKARPDGGS